MNIRKEKMSKKFLIPVSIAATALMANNSGATIQIEPFESKNVNSASQPDSTAIHVGVTTHVIQYLKGDEKHELFMKKSDTGLIFAGHSSHASHGSHGSHRSGR